MSKRNIRFTKPPEPAFLKQMKEKIGYQEKDTIETKKKMAPFDPDEDDEFEREDEKPVVVILNPEVVGEPSIGENDSLLGGSATDKKIIFCKPVKRSADEDGSSFVSSTKKNKTEKTKKSKENKSRKIQNSSLLSFDDDEDT